MRTWANPQVKITGSLGKGVDKLDISEAVTKSAIERKESRGGQYRDDFPQKDPEWAKKNLVIRKQPDGSMSISEVPIPEMPAELKQIIEEMG